MQDAHYKSAAKLGHGAGFLYAHDYKNHYVRQQYLPDALKDSRFYEMTEIGYEKKMKEHLDKIKAEAESERRSISIDNQEENFHINDRN